MRKSKAETAETRQRIVATAAKEFRRQGIEATGLAELMAAAGLTHGGFYRHFASKDQLVAEACAAALASSRETLAAAAAGKPPGKKLPAIVGKYLSTLHRDHPQQGCLFAAVGSEVARADQATRDTATANFLKLVDLLANHIEGVRPREAKRRALALASAMIGGLMMSRIVTDEGLSAEILRSGQHLAELVVGDTSGSR